jgi:DNA-directed RNA polymerase subunit H (RpoH/RPB5)
MDKFYKAYVEVIKMLEIREWITAEEALTYELPIEEFIARKTRDISKLNIIGTSRLHSKPFIVVFYNEDIKAYKTKGQILELLKTRLNEDQIKTNYIILIFSKSDDTEITHSQLYKREKELFHKEQINLQIFSTNFLCCKILDNCIMPKYKLIRDLDEKDTILTIGNKSIMNNMLPYAPVARYYGAVKDDIFEITTASSEGIKVSWRIVT